ncbi:MAG: arginine--tRNA ligase [Anaeroplasmataceae bacterium]
MLDIIKKNIKEKIEEFYLKEYKLDINVILEEPKNQSMGDISIPTFSIVKILRKPMPEIINEIISITNTFDIIEESKITGPYINLVLNKQKFSKDVLDEVFEKKSMIGSSNLGNNKNIAIDYSSPNIAKSFSIGHLRSTMIGNSLKLIFKKLGYDVTSINYLGDWGTQFGKIIVALEKWGNKEAIEKDSINELSRLYVKFHNEVENDKTLDDKAREIFRKIESNDPKYLELWRWVRDESLKESKQIYDLLNVTFDSYNGESYYNDKMDAVVDELKSKNLLIKDQGAMIVKLEDDIPPALIKRKDGGSLYITRDLAAVFDRKNSFNFHKCLYVVGNEQKLHFKQLSSVINKMNYDFYKDLVHINFGLYLSKGVKMSTRSGNVVKLYDILEKAINLAKEQIKNKNPELDNIDDIAKSVGVGAIVFNDLKNHRTSDIDFDLDQMLKFEGQTGPYVQYTIVRILSVLSNCELDNKNIDISIFNQPHYFELIKLIDSFGSIILKSSEEYSPSIIAKYLLLMAQTFNKFYSIEKINNENEVIKNTNFSMCFAIKTILIEGLRLLGIDSVNKM